MNKLITLLLAVMVASIPVVALAKKQDYKCFVNLMPKGDKVVFYRWDVNEANRISSNLAGKQLRDSDGNRVYIKKVVECVPLNNDFMSSRAQEVDSKTLR
ncbi:TapY2 family type IVa secretion system protein [Shewanella sp.]|uniref:TapY2 family type IVa secretion system protein n=1 Tax=Shewanella sp. TaxID=50422 RepID=UPI003566C539